MFNSFNATWGDSTMNLQFKLSWHPLAGKANSLPLCGCGFRCRWSAQISFHTPKKIILKNMSDFFVFELFFFHCIPCKNVFKVVKVHMFALQLKSCVYLRVFFLLLGKLRILIDFTFFWGRFCVILMLSKNKFSCFFFFLLYIQNHEISIEKFFFFVCEQFFSVYHHK